MHSYGEFEELITPEEVAEILNCGMNNMYKLLNEGKVKGFRIGRLWKIPKRSVQEYILQQSNLAPRLWH